MRISEFPQMSRVVVVHPGRGLDFDGKDIRVLLKDEVHFVPPAGPPMVDGAPRLLFSTNRHIVAN